VLIDRGGYQVYDLNDKMLTEVRAARPATTRDLQSIDATTGTSRIS
jgi:hypothetical protein